jgi:hypothetical protein
LFSFKAAHCIKPSLVSLRVGEWDLQTDIDCDENDLNTEGVVCAPAPIDIKIIQIIKHPEYVALK